MITDATVFLVFLWCPLAGIPGSPCFSRDTKVMTRDSPEPIALRDLLVGQHVL